MEACAGAADFGRLRVPMKNALVFVIGGSLWRLLLVTVGAVEVQPLISIAEARAKQGVADGTEVRVMGQVTFCSQPMGIAFVQDETGGIGFDPRLRKKAAPKVGELVEVRGKLGRRQGMVMILNQERNFGAPEVEVVGVSEKRIAAKPFDLDEAAEMRVDGLLTRVSGVVRRISQGVNEQAPIQVEISSTSGYAIARLPWIKERPSADEMNGWINQVVTVHGVLVCLAAPPFLVRDAQALILVPGKAAWRMEPEALDEVFARKPITFSETMPMTTGTQPRDRLHLSGVVTAAKARRWVSLRTATGSVQVQTRQMGTFVPGERLSIACWQQNLGGQVTLLDGVCRSRGYEALPDPLMIEPTVEGELPPVMELVRMTGELRNHAISGGVPHLSLVLANGRSFELEWRMLLKEEQVAKLEDGSRIEVTGLLKAKHEDFADEASISYSVMPRSMADITQLRLPSWWTRSRLSFAAWALFGVVMVMVPTALFSRRHIHRQERQIRVIELRAAAEEERRRIAREFHDTLQQQLSAATLHLETLKGAIKAAPEMIPGLVDDTTAMVRHCQIEARHCLWDLRTEAPAREDLAEALRQWLAMRGAQIKSAQLHFEVRGEVPPLTEDVPFQVLRIAQEAVNNALAHATATQVSVRLDCRKTDLVLDVRDDGRGFNTEEIHVGHFGLTGQKERAQKIGATLHFISHPEDGTRVTLNLPIHAFAHASVS